MLTVLVIVFWFILVILAIVFCAIFAMEATGSKMFSIITTISVSVVFCVINISIYLLFNNHKDNETNSNNYSTEQTFYYQMTATAVNENTFITEDGNMWRMKNINIEKGKKYQLTFDNHDTEIITDDEIVDFIELNEKVD
jgi:energy-coupling factor transporter transmembrane protein EcfT